MENHSTPSFIFIHAFVEVFCCICEGIFMIAVVVVVVVMCRDGGR